MSKASSFVGREFIWLRNYFLKSKRGPLFLIILFVLAIPATTFLISNSQQGTFRSTPSQISACTCVNGGVIVDGFPHTEGDGLGTCGYKYQDAYGKGEWWACTDLTGDNGWRQIQPGGCINGSIKDVTTGDFITNYYVGTDTEGVCGSNGLGYRCTNGAWLEETDEDLKYCGPQGTNRCNALTDPLQCNATAGCYNRNVSSAKVECTEAPHGPNCGTSALYHIDYYCQANEKCVNGTNNTKTCVPDTAQGCFCEGGFIVGHGGKETPYKGTCNVDKNLEGAYGGRWSCCGPTHPNYKESDRGWIEATSCSTEGSTDCPPAYDIPSNSNKTNGTICGNSSDVAKDPNKYTYKCENNEWKAYGECNPANGTQTTCSNTWDHEGKPANGKKPGEKICGNSGTPNDPKKYFYVCQNNGDWKVDGECTPGTEACTCTGGSVKIDGSTNNNYTAKCGDIVCGSDNKSYTCTSPGGDYTNYKYTSATCAGSGNPQPPANNPPNANPPGTNPSPTPVIPTGVVASPTPTTIPASPTATGIPPTGVQPTGGISPTATSVPGSTNLNLILAVDGVGNQTGNGQNNAPTPNPMKAFVQILDASGNKVAETSGDATYDTAAGAFKGKFPVNIATGAYNIKARFDNTLWKKITRTLTSGQDNNLPYTKLINGDINQDNQLNLLDYTMMLSCMKNGACDGRADLNLDGKIEAKDLNLLYYHFKNREGD